MHSIFCLILNGVNCKDETKKRDIHQLYQGVIIRWETAETTKKNNIFVHRGLQIRQSSNKNKENPPPEQLPPTRPTNKHWIRSTAPRPTPQKKHEQKAKIENTIIDKKDPVAEVSVPIKKSAIPDKIRNNAISKHPFI